MSKKPLKILLHHDLSDSVKVEKMKPAQGRFKRAWLWLVNSLASLSYGIGVVIITILKSPLTLLRQFTWPQGMPGKEALVFVLIVTLALTPIFGLSLLSEGWRLGGRVLGVSENALTDIQQARDAVNMQDYAGAQVRFTEALSKLEGLQTQFDQSSNALRTAGRLAPGGLNPENLLNTAQLLTEAGALASGLLVQVNGLSYTPAGLSSTHGSGEEAIKALANDSQKLHQNLAQANRYLQALNTTLLPAEYQIIISDTRDLVADLTQQTKQLQDLSTLLADLMLGQKSFLIVLQNNNELRPNGGFIGTIAQGKIDNGAISKLDIRSVYDLDGQILEWIKPPGPLQAVNSRLFLRDSNWFVSFPESAQRLSVMYEKSGGETPDLVVAFTPELFLDFLDLTGPIALPGYNVTISSANFIEQIQTTTSIAYDLELNQPKQLLADLYPVLMQRLGELSKQEPLLFLSLLQKNLAAKNVLLYSRHQSLQDRFDHYRWSGAVSPASLDYLQINSANLGGTKTDRLLIREAKLSTSIDADGFITNQLTYTVTNPLPNIDGLHNRSWLRILVPENSKLLGVSGFSIVEIEDLPEDAEYKPSDAIQSWEDRLRYDSALGAYIGSEAGKTYFANWLEVAGGETKTISLSYQLPRRLVGRTASYQLLWEKQPGMINLNIQQELITNKGLFRWSNLSNPPAEPVKQLYWQKDMTTDMFVGTVITD